MRMTMTIDDATAKALEDLARRLNKPFEELVDEILRAGLSARSAPTARPYRVKPVSLGGVAPGIDLDKALALADELEDQERASKALIQRSVRRR